MATETLKEQQPKVHERLSGFDIKINSFGEISSTMNIDSLNDFLNGHVVDKKLKAREDLKVKRS